MNYFLAFTCTFLFAIYGSAQTFEDLKAPTMPAATMIGSQVNEISSPSSLKALEASLLNNFMDSSNKFVIPDGYALEFNPFMLVKGDKFHYMDYLETKPENLYRNLTFSLASTNSFIVNDTVKTNGLGFGLRWVFYNGKVDDETKRKYLSALSESDGLMSTHGLFMSYVADFVESIEEVDKSKNIDLVVLRKFLNDSFIMDGEITTNEAKYLLLLEQLPITTTYNELDVKLNELVATTYRQKALTTIKGLMEDTKMNRYGFRLELNGAMGLSFPTRDFGHSYVPKYGGWLNISYRIPKKSGETELINGKEVNLKKATPFEFVGLMRLTSVSKDFVNSFKPLDSLNYDPGVYVDFGLRANFDYKKLNIGLEYIYRQNRSKEYVIVDDFEYSRTVNNDTYKFLLNINYNITDNMVISYNIGKNYNFGGNGKGNLISGITLNLGFGDVSEKDLMHK